MNQIELGFWVRSFWSSLHPRPHNRLRFYALARAFFPWYGVAEFNKPIRNLLICAPQH